MRPALFIAVLLPLVVLITGSKVKKGDDDYVWHDLEFDPAECDPINPRANGAVSLSGDNSGVLPTECGAKSKKRLFRELLMELRGFKNHKRITGGTETTPNEYPWLAAIGPEIFFPLTVGSLITDQFVLTLASGFFEEEYPCRFNIRLGEHDLFIDEGTSIDVEGGNIFVHPNYNATTEENDIALIKLAQPVDLSSSQIGPACLADSMDNYPVGTSCYLAGWGVLDNGEWARTLHHVEMDLLEPTTCKQQYGLSFDPVCGGNTEGRAANGCTRDQGSPLVCANGDTWDIVGIFLSGSNDCGKDGNPDIFTPVHAYKDWIEAVIANNS